MGKKIRSAEKRLNEAILSKDEQALRAMAPDLEGLKFYFSLGKCLHAIGDADLIRDFYRKNPQAEFLEAFFFLKRNVPFNTSPNWVIAEGTKFGQKYEAWVKSKSGEARGMGHNYIARVVSGVESFMMESGQEKAAIAIANSGLYGGFLAKGLGIDTFVVDSHRKGNGASYEERDSFNVAGKDVLIIDNDVDSGRTIKRVAREISRKNPKKISFLFYNTPGYEALRSYLAGAGYPDSPIYRADHLQDSPNTLDLIDKIEKDD